MHTPVLFRKRAGTQIGETFFSILSSNFLPLPEFLRVLTHLIANAGSCPWHGAPTEPFWPAAALTKTIQLWDAQIGKVKWTLTGHSDR
jgi:hypothetical protein